MRKSGRAPADIDPAGAGDTIPVQKAKAAGDLARSGQRDHAAEGESAAHPPRLVLCRVDGLADLTYDTRELRLAIKSGGPFGFRAGQYVQIEFAPGLNRPYSMASTPAEKHLVFLLRRTAEGKSSSHVAQQLKLGDKVKVSGPLGSAYLRDSHAGPVLLVAGGSGLAPMLSILRTLLARDGGTPVELYFGVRSERDVYHERLLAGLAARHKNFSFRIVLSEPGSDRGRRHGLVHEAVAADLAEARGYTAYLAGPSAMVDAAGRLLLERGVARRDIHADAFRYPPGVR